MITGFKQSISDQTRNFGFQFNTSIDDLTKKVNVGFSGTDIVNWMFYQGRIYDNQNRFCGSYLRNQQTSISGTIGAFSYDYYINGTPIALGSFKSSGTINYLYANSESGNSVKINSNVVAESIPSFSLSKFINAFQGFTGVGNFTNNSNVNFRIFSGVNDNSSIIWGGNSTGDIAPGNSGLFYLYVSGAKGGINYSGNFTFYTNFGLITSPIVINSLSTGLQVTKFSYSPNNFKNFIGAPNILQSDAGSINILTISGTNYISPPNFNVSLSYSSGVTGIGQTFTGTWNLSTGLSLSTLTDFKQNSWYDYTGFQNPSGPINNISSTNIYVKIDYTPRSDYNVDVAELFITGLNSGIRILITGQRS